MTTSRKPRRFPSVHALDLVVASVENSGKMRGFRRCIAAADRSIVQNDHGSAFRGEQIGRRKAGDAGANDAYIRCDVLCERGMKWYSPELPSLRTLACD